MPRDINGIYTLPAGNPVVTGTVIETGWANPTMSDIGNALTTSLSRTGEGTMQAQFRAIGGNAAAPGISFTASVNSGMYLLTSPVRCGVSGQGFAGLEVSLNTLNLNDGGSTVSLSSTLGINVGSLAPASNSHIQIASRALQAKMNSATAGVISINPLGGDTKLGAQSAAAGEVLGYRNALRAFSTGNDKFILFADTSTPSKHLLEFHTTTDAPVVKVGIEDTFGNAVIENEQGGASTFIRCSEFNNTPLEVASFSAIAGGAGKPGMTSDRLALYAGDNIDLVGNAPPLVVGDNVEQVVIARNKIQARDLNLVTGIDLVLNELGGYVSLYGDAVGCASTINPSNGGFQVNNLLTGTGFERVLTTSDMGGGGSPPVVPNYRGTNYYYQINEASAAANDFFNWTTGGSGGQFLVTGTGGSGDFIWPALDSLPVGAISIDVFVTFSVNVTALGMSLSLDARSPLSPGFPSTYEILHSNQPAGAIGDFKTSTWARIGVVNREFYIRYDIFGDTAVTRQGLMTLRGFSV